LDDEDAMAARIAAILEQKQPIAARLVRVHQYYWLRIWLETGTKGRSGDVPRSAEDMHDYLFTLGESS
jgi:endo-beta-N-acetylglucosaminidase D